jgi:hypothetical protein
MLNIIFSFILGFLVSFLIFFKKSKKELKVVSPKTPELNISDDVIYEDIDVKITEIHNLDRLSFYPFTKIESNNGECFPVRIGRQGVVINNMSFPIDKTYETATVLYSGSQAWTVKWNTFIKIFPKYKAEVIKLYLEEQKLIKEKKEVLKELNDFQEYAFLKD